MIDLQIDNEGIATLSMQDVAGKNAFSIAFVRELVAALKSCDDPRIKVCVIKGLPEVFSAGGDREVLSGLARGEIQPYDLTLTRTLLDVPVPTIAAMRGHAVGGGLVFGLACDLAILGLESRYGANFMEMGFTPGMGTTRLLQVAMGEYVAAEMMYGCQYFRGRALLGKANVNDILSKDEVEPRAFTVASRIAERPRFALELLKRSLSANRKRLFEEARTMESMMHEICFAHPETKSRIAENYTEISKEKPQS
jgi:polyketide biosynthesis enoyl-CoA hydratase PksI